MLTEYVKERLAQLLEDHRPRRAQAGAGGPGVRPLRSLPTPEAGGSARRRPGAVPLHGLRPPGLPPVGGTERGRSHDDGVEDGADLDAGSWPRRATAAPEPPDPQPDRWWTTSAAPGHGPVDATVDVLDLGSEDPDSPVDDGYGERSGRRRVFGRVHVGVVAALLLVAVLWAGWTVLRARPVALAATPVPVGSSRDASPAASGSSPAGSASPTAAASGATSSSTPPIEVHVLGAVRKPGVVSLRAGLRVDDAIAAAGGLTRDAAPGELNLAQVLQDGQQVVIGTKAEPSGEVRDGSADGIPGAASSGSPGAVGAVDLNSATETQLEELPGVGPVTAGKIVAWRQEHGRFSRVEELQEIDGIGPKTYAQIAPHARV